MSRCFPFPPPGYEKKPRPEEDLVKEEKSREKRHKKEKKDKEKREGKDKKEKDKSDGKHKEKKDKKEKHRDKKEKHRDKKDKEKDKSKDREKSSISEDASIAWEPETRSREKVYTKEERPNEKSPIGNRLPQENHGFTEKKLASQFQGQNGQNFIANRLVRESEESKFVQELGRRIRDDGKAIGSQSVRRSSAADRRGYQETHGFAVRDPQNLAEDKEGGNKDRKTDNRMLDNEGLKDGPRFSENTMVRGLAASGDYKVEGMPGPVQKDREAIVEGKVKPKDRGTDKRGEKRKDKDKKEKKSHGKDKGRENEKKKEGKARERTEHKNCDLDRSKDVFRNEYSGLNNNSSSYVSATDEKIGSIEGNVKKRKDVETNGFVHENEIRQNKLPRLTSYQPMDNSRISEACQAPALLNSDRLGVTDRDKMDNKRRRVNGIVNAPSFYKLKQKSLSALTSSDQVAEASRTLQASQVIEASTKPPLAEKATDASKRAVQDSQAVEASKKRHQADQIAESSRKPPHPDLKYLSQVLSVPKMEEWSEVDDQEWLFSGKVPPHRKQLEVSTSGDGKHAQLWAEALHIESADIYALPYVIPY